MNTHIITYTMGKLGKFLMGREEGSSAYYVIKRDVFDKLQDAEIVKFVVDKGVIMNPSFADETIARFIQEYPKRVFVDKNAIYAVKKVYETLEITNKIEIEYI